MNNLFKIDSGVYRLKSRNFDFSVTEEIAINDGGGRILLLISGENGSGKSTFLEKVIIPELRRNSRQFIYKAQDLDLQSIIDRCVTAIYNLSGLGSKLLSQILFNTGAEEIVKGSYKTSAGLLIMDETDKLLSESELREYFSNPDIKLIILVSHNVNRPGSVGKDKYFDAIYNYRVSGSGVIRKVELIK